MQSAKCKVQNHLELIGSNCVRSRKRPDELIRPFVFYILRFTLCISVQALALQLASAQAPPPETIKLPVPAKAEGYESVKVDKPKIVLNEQGHAWEAAVSFLLNGRDSVALEVALGEPGRFDVEMLYTKGLVELKNVRVEDGVGKAEVVRKAQPMSSEELLRRRDEELDKLVGKKPDSVREKLLREKLEAAAKANPRRFSTQEKESWKAMKPGELLAYYRRILQTEIAEEHLSRCGLDYDRSTRDAAEKVIPMFLALHFLMTDQAPGTDEEKKAVKEGMTGGSGVLWKALTADLRLRIYSETDSSDPNSQWFNAQRIASRATGVGSIRVEGSLDPAKGDRADWWTIDRWEPGSIQYTTSTDGGVLFDPPLVVDGAAHLRIRSEKAARYWFEMRAERGGDLKVVVHESHIPAESKFPY
jgi:hypothetical protein